MEPGADLTGATGEMGAARLAMHILLITSCTGEKIVSHERALTREDFLAGDAHIAVRERDLKNLLTPAEDLYSGQQHVRLMRAVRTLRRRDDADGLTIDLRILSAGYGLVASDRRLAPYECTYQGLSRREIRELAEARNVPRDIRRTLAAPYDLALILLGDAYLAACALDDTVRLGGPTIVFCGSEPARRLPALTGLRIVRLANPEAKRFSCGIIGLKGELAGRALTLIGADPAVVAEFRDPAVDVLALLDRPEFQTPKTPKIARVARPHPDVDRVVDIPSSWWRKPHRDKLRYFIPDWDDLVDPDYDFATDTHASDLADWTNEVYAHQLYPEPNYDGLLVSKIVAEANARKRERINRLGVHRLLRVPPAFPVMGDCGAFGYAKHDVPPYTTGEILDYYTRLGFTHGVSIDHLIFTSDPRERARRQGMTEANAAEFLDEHRRRGLTWTPVGAVQGWSPASYAASAAKYARMGYRYIGLGGLVRSSTAEIKAVVRAVRARIPAEVQIHLFGVARRDALADFVRLGVNSVDSASALRKAWLGSDKNYLTLNDAFAALRVPQSASFRAKQVVAQGLRSAEDLRRLEEECLRGLHHYGASTGGPPSALLDLLTEYDALVAPASQGSTSASMPRKGTRERIARTLEARPWEECGCAICARWGIDIAIFRGNNRNRRRGFHNAYVFYRQLQQELAPESVRFEAERIGATAVAPDVVQYDLFPVPVSDGAVAR